MFGIFDIRSYSYRESVRKSKVFRTTDGMHGNILFEGCNVGYESGLEKTFSLMMAIDPQVTGIFHQPMTFYYQVECVAKPLHYTPDYRVTRDLDRPWIWGDQIERLSVNGLFEVKPQEVLDKNTPLTEGAQCSLFSKIRSDGEFDVRIFTDKSTSKVLTENIKRVGNARPILLDQHIAFECLETVRRGSTLELPKLIEKLFERGVTPIPTILSLMKSRRIAGQYHRADFLDLEALVLGD